jgi:hypothetical protein
MKRHEFARSFLLAAGLALIAACANGLGIQTVAAAPAGEVKKAEDVKPTACTNPRPQLCTMDHRPVCATRDTGIRCVSAPCPSTEKRTYSNGCGACSDPKVYGYVPGACPEARPNVIDPGVDG